MRAYQQGPTRNEKCGLSPKKTDDKIPHMPGLMVLHHIWPFFPLIRELFYFTFLFLQRQLSI